MHDSQHILKNDLQEHRLDHVRLTAQKLQCKNSTSKCKFFKKLEVTKRKRRKLNRRGDTKIRIDKMRSRMPSSFFRKFWPQIYFVTESILCFTFSLGDGGWRAYYVKTCYREHIMSKLVLNWHLVSEY